MAGQRRRALDSDHHASGFVIDAKGSDCDEPAGRRHRDVGGGAALAGGQSGGGVLAADPARDVAVLWIDPKVAASVRPVPLGCAQAAKPAVVDGQEIFTIGAPLREEKAHGVRDRRARGDARRSCPTSASHRQRRRTGLHRRRRRGRDHLDRGREGSAQARDSRVVRIDDACDVVASAEKKMKDAARPSGAHLPVEPARPFPIDALKERATPRRQPEPLSDVLGRLRRRLHHAGADLRRAVPVGAGEGRERGQRSRAARRGAASRAPAHGLQQLVRVRGGLSAGAAGPRDAEAGRGLLDDGCARRRADAGCGRCPRSSTSSQASRGCAPSAATPR